MLKLNAVAIARGQTRLLFDIDLTITAGEIVVLLGDSGCGKTTLLRAIAGLEPLLAGDIALGTQALASDGRQRVPPGRRGLGLVFQDGALFPHLNVADNLGFGVERQRRHDRVQIIARAMGLKTLLQRFPHQLSGGQQRRVAVARSLAAKPQALLLDEPFAGLDRQHRSQLQLEVAQRLRDEQIAALWVTHDLSEALTIADRLGVIADGTIVQLDQPAAIQQRPANQAVVDRLQLGQLIPITNRQGDRIECELGSFTTLTNGSGVAALVRPNDVEIADTGVTATITGLEAGMLTYRLTLALPSGVLVDCYHDHKLPIGSQVAVQPTSQVLLTL